jgi:hypothetical protein
MRSGPQLSQQATAPDALEFWQPNRQRYGHSIICTASKIANIRGVANFELSEMGIDVNRVIDISSLGFTVENVNNEAISGDIPVNYATMLASKGVVVVCFLPVESVLTISLFFRDKGNLGDSERWFGSRSQSGTR